MQDPDRRTSVWYVFNIAVKEESRWNLVGVQSPTSTQVPFKGGSFQWSLSEDLAGVQNFTIKCVSAKE
ncbi:hypothetical protein CapIbe_023941 [Capra ibex]